MPIIQPTPIDQLPQPPNPADRSNFNSLAYPFTAAMLPLTEQINQAISDTYNNALEAEAKASEASVSAGEASVSAGAAHDSELAAQAAEEMAESHKNAAEAAALGDIGPATHAATAKSAPADADEFALADSAADWSLKKLTWGSLKAALAPPSATYEYDELGRVDKILTPDGDTLIAYNPDGTVETITYPTGRVETYTYDASGNVISMTATGGEA